MEQDVKIIRSNQRVNNATLFVPFSSLPEARTWKVGKVYRVQASLKQTGISKDGATFSLTSIRSEDTQTHKHMSEGGYMKG